MKTIFFFLITCITTVHAQEWKKYHRSELGLPYTLVQSDYMTSGRHFRINPYDNSLWMSNQFVIQTISTDGIIQYFSTSNTPLFQYFFEWITFEFFPDKVISLETGKGLFTYENQTWSNIYDPPGKTHGMAKDVDSIYILRENQLFEKWYNGSAEALYNSWYTKRIIAKNNRFWLSNGVGTLGLEFYSETGVYDGYDPSNSLIMDNGNYDYKFSPHHDTLYVAGNKGLSLLHDLTFFDSIAPDNTANMPTGIIMDFEFDADDNIWALFGSNAYTATSIAHYDQPSKTWDVYYDANNANLNFNTYCSIELDTEGNLWMVNQSYIHVLGLGELPVWLSAKQPSFQQNVSVFPNPVSDVFHIETDAIVSEVYVTDQLGKRIKTLNPKDKTYSMEGFPAGIYFVEIINEANEKSTVKLIKN